MEKYINTYTLLFDELQELTESSYYVRQGDSDKIADDILSLLINAYNLGLKSTEEMLDYEVRADIDEMSEIIFMLIDGKTFEDRVAEHVSAKDLTGLSVLAESEFHRVYNATVERVGERIEKESGRRITKTWYTVRDEKVRDTHRYLEGQKLKLREEFFTYDGDHALYPGGFTKAENNVNCRCITVLEYQG